MNNLYKKFQESTGVSTDTRSDLKGKLFFALKGPNFNANAFAAQALDKGALAVVIDEPQYKVSEDCIVVSDALKALQALANEHRRQLKIPVIAIGGSNGKTTTKELTGAVLSKKYKTFCTKGNLNNHIGVPLTLLSITPDIEIAVIELGANHLHETEFLCGICEPDFGIVTNIGMDHLEGFGSVEGVAKANSELYYYLLKKGGNIFVNSTDSMLMRMASRFQDPIKYPQTNDFLYCETYGNDLYIKVKTEKNTIISTNLVGDYNTINIAAALAIGKFFRVNFASACKAIEEYVPQNNRSQVVTKGTNTVILDCYNANPSSMEVSIGNFGKLDKKPKMLILGDMFELGNVSKEEHYKLGKLTTEYTFEKVLLCGEAMAEAKKANQAALYFKTKDELNKYLSDNPVKGHTLLLKGSRGMKLETVMDLLPD